MKKIDKKIAKKAEKRDNQRNNNLGLKKGVKKNKRRTPQERAKRKETVDSAKGYLGGFILIILMLLFMYAMMAY